MGKVLWAKLGSLRRSQTREPGVRRAIDPWYRAPPCYGAPMRIAVASDHAGFPLKQAVLEWLRELGHEPVDMGVAGTDPVDYPDVIAPAARAVASGQVERAIVLGGSGTGEAIVANKVRGIRCVEASDPVVARLGREHNDANVLSMGARIVGGAIARACVEAFLEGGFEGGRHVARIEKISRLEEQEAERR